MVVLVQADIMSVTALLGVWCMTRSALSVIFVFSPFQEEGSNGVNYRGSVDVKAELGRTQSKVTSPEQGTWLSQRSLCLVRVAVMLRESALEVSRATSRWPPRVPARCLSDLLAYL